jgi:hypothetical protein
LYGNTAGNLPIGRIPCNALRSILQDYGVNEKLLTEKMIEESVKNMKKNGNPIDFSDLQKLQYNVYSLNETGWSNIDWMLKVPDERLKTIFVEIEPSEYTDCKIIFKNKRTIIPASRKNKSKFTFPLIPIGEPARLLLINTNASNGKVQVQLLDIVTNEQTIVPQLRTISLDEFLPFLKQINKP